jgi:hypothetical protein
VKRLLLLLEMVVACGADPELGRMTAEVRLDPQLVPSDIKSLDIYLFSGHDSTGARFDCTTLAGRSPASVGPGALHRAHDLVSTLADAHIPGLSPETGLVLAADGYPTTNGMGTRNAFGCADGIAIQAGQSTPVTLILLPAL